MKIKSRYPRDILNEIKWKGYDFSKIEIYFINRGSPNDIAIINGSKILAIERGFIKLHSLPFETYIPYHRVRLITYNGEKVFER